MLSDIAADHVHNPRNRGPMEGATHFGTCGIRGDGPYVEIWLEIRDHSDGTASAENHDTRDPKPETRDLTPDTRDPRPETSEAVIVRATYRTPGCPSSTAAASMTCQLMIGRTTEQATLLQAGDLLQILGGLPEGKEEYAAMCVKALNAALAGRLVPASEESDAAADRPAESGGPSQREQVA